MIELVDKLRLGGVEIYRARQPFSENGETWAAGTYVIPFTQVFARYAKDLLEVQTYPAGQRTSPSGGSDGPYDVSAWSLGMQFGVKTVFAHEPLPANLALEPVAQKTNYLVAAERNGANIRFPYTGARERGGREPAAEGGRSRQPGESARRLQRFHPNWFKSGHSDDRDGAGLSSLVRRDA